ncbi:hypothetical protein J2Y48_001104 [Mycoplana sp. BE70]|nr:hypothetical protein [Mycoplana sp. BE70]MDR6755819.1 hypothetical protein [Mycoplana sp. BE70]
MPEQRGVRAGTTEQALKDIGGTGRIHFAVHFFQLRHRHRNGPDWRSGVWACTEDLARTEDLAGTEDVQDLASSIAERLEDANTARDNANERVTVETAGEDLRATRVKQRFRRTFRSTAGFLGSDGFDEGGVDRRGCIEHRTIRYQAGRSIKR